MNKSDLAKLPAFPHREFTEDETERLVQMVKEAEEKYGGKRPTEFRREHLKRMGVTMVEGEQ